MNIDHIWRCLEAAVMRFNASVDRESLLGPRTRTPSNRSDRVAAGERAIAYRLAFYLETELRRRELVSDQGPISVDCEYNRHISGGKSLAAGAEEDILRIITAARRKVRPDREDGFYVFSIAPDIVVHQRQSDEHNLLVVEIKKRSNPETDQYDCLKLELFRNNGVRDNF